jgi:hypothetical protein
MWREEQVWSRSVHLQPFCYQSTRIEKIGTAGLEFVRHAGYAHAGRRHPQLAVRTIVRNRVYNYLFLKKLKAGLAPLPNHGDDFAKPAAD